MTRGPGVGAGLRLEVQVGFAIASVVHVDRGGGAEDIQEVAEGSRGHAQCFEGVE